MGSLSSGSATATVRAGVGVESALSGGRWERTSEPALPYDYHLYADCPALEGQQVVAIDRYDWWLPLEQGSGLCGGCAARAAQHEVQVWRIDGSDEAPWYFTNQNDARLALVELYADLDLDDSVARPELVEATLSLLQIDSLLSREEM